MSRVSKKPPFPQSSLQNLLASVLTNKHSDFYRRYISHDPKKKLARSDWYAIPFVDRKRINDVPFWKRSFVPKNEVPFTRNTYGTSGNRILVTPRNVSGDYSNPYRELKTKRMMSFFASGYHEFPRTAIPEMHMWFGDVSNLDISADIAAEARIDSLYITPYTALLIAPLLKERGVIDNVHAVQLTGERCSPLQLTHLESLYKNAVVYGHYASSETREGVAVSCAHEKHKKGSLVMEAMPGMYCELVDVHTREPIEEPEVHGELVVTTLLTDVPFPLVRYLTGDIAVYRARDCGCDAQQWAFEVVGRDSVFPIKVARGEVTADSFEQVLYKLGTLETEYFEAHYGEEEKKGQVLPRIHMKVIPKNGKRLSQKKLASEIAEELYMFPSYTYAKGVEDGVYLPLSVSFIEKPKPGPTGKGKPPVIVRSFAGSNEELREPITKKSSTEV